MEWLKYTQVIWTKKIKDKKIKDNKENKKKMTVDLNP